MEHVSGYVEGHITNDTYTETKMIGFETATLRLIIPESRYYVQILIPTDMDGWTDG